MSSSSQSSAEHLQGPIGRALVWFTSTRIGQLIYVRVVPPIDRRMMLKSKGQKSLSPHGDPNGPGGLALLSTIGSKTGKERHTPLGYARDGDNIVMLASNAARSYHPNWYYNLKKHPEVTITLGGGPQNRYRAEEIPDGPERERLWKVMTSLNPGFDEYPARTKGRLIPVINCTPIKD
ncbi:MAG: nitroreductase/quinone reductase family protein [Acidimicrobiia bacterium]